MDVTVYSPDGRLLASGGEEGKVLLHDLSAGERRAEGWNDERIWEALADRNAANAEKAAQMLRGRPREAFALLSARLAPVPAIDTSRLRRLIEDLDHRRFVVRTEAAQELEKLGRKGQSALQQTLERH